MPSRGGGKRHPDPKLSVTRHNSHICEYNPRSLKSVAACILSNALGFGTRVFPAVQWTDLIDRTELFAGLTGFDERTCVRQLAASTAIDALISASLGNGQHGRSGPSCLGGPGVFLFISHSSGCSYDFLKTATTFSTSTTNSRLSPSKSTGIASLGLNSTLSY